MVLLRTRRLASADDLVQHHPEVRGLRGRKMRPLGSRWARGVVLWTLVLLVVAIVLAVGAMASLGDAQQACFFSSTVACPDGQDWRVGLLTFA